MESQVILITGASSGIGYETAKALALQGHRVYGAARRTDRIAELATFGVQAVSLDVTDEASVTAAVEKVLQAEGRIDVLVNNAGYGYFGAIADVPLEEARRQLEVNVFGLASLTRKVLPGMLGRKKGRIVNIASVAGRVNIYLGGWYHVSKFAVETFSDALRMEVEPHGIRVSVIEPGAIGTAWGLIAADHLKETAAGSFFENDALAEADVLKKAYSSRWLSKPEVVTKAILKAVNRKRPRTRYKVGKGAHLLVILHALLPDRMWDGMMRQICHVKLP